jgi:hypothetical protein
MKTYIFNYNFMRCFVWVWKFVFHAKRKPSTDGEISRSHYSDLNLVLNLIFVFILVYYKNFSGDRCSIPGRGRRIFRLTSVSRPALWSTQHFVEWVPGVLSPGAKWGRGMTLITHPRLVPRSWMSRSRNSSPPFAFMLWDCFTFYKYFYTI